MNQSQVIHRMTAAQKLKASDNLYWAARELKAAWLRSIHPQWTEAEVQKKVREIFLYARD